MNIGKLTLSLALTAGFLNADWQSQLGNFFQQASKKDIKQNEVPKTTLSSFDMNSALKEALNQGVKYATSTLGKDGGFLNNPLVRIPIPKSLEKSANIVKKFGGEKYVEELEISINKAAQKAAPKTAEIFFDAIKNMSIDDAKKILSGNKHEATNYFREKSSNKLIKVIKPIVQESMKESNVYKYYSLLNKYYKKHSGLLKNSMVTSITKQFGFEDMLPQNNKDENLDEYITNKTIDGLMLMIAKKEEEIRKNPLLQNSKIIKKVFSMF